MLNFSKALKMFPRFFAFMEQGQKLSVYSLIFTRFELLEKLTIPLHEKTEQVDLFMNLLLPPLVDILSVVGLEIINGLVRIFIERHDMVWVCRSRVGLALMTAFLSRAEILKSSEDQKDEDVSLW
jgi:DNA topoisomerase 2-associated protein PAT1